MVVVTARRPTSPVSTSLGNVKFRHETKSLGLLITKDYEGPKSQDFKETFCKTPEKA